MTDELEIITDDDRAALMREGIVVLATERHLGRMWVSVTSLNAERARDAVHARLGDGVDVAVFGDTPREVQPIRCEGYMEREEGRLQLRYVMQGDQHLDHILVAEDAETVVVFGMSCNSPLGPEGEAMECPYHEYLRQPLGDRRVIDGVTGDPVPFKNVYDHLRVKYGLQGG